MARKMNASLRETDSDREIDGCAGRERKQQITHQGDRQLDRQAETTADK